MTAVIVWDREASCNGKNGYQTPQMAFRVAKKSRKFAAKPYRCSHCGKFHVAGYDIGKQ